MTNFYDFEAKKANGETISMSEYKGKTVLVVNTATKCGLSGQFDGLEEIYQKYKDKDFIILGFPCNQFGNQEPGNNEEVNQTCKLNFGVTFPLFAKVDVNGKDADPIFKYLRKELGGLFGNKIKWNFTKFLVNKEGKPVKRFAPTKKPEDMQKDIEKYL